jgi:hypothetical protein
MFVRKIGLRAAGGVPDGRLLVTREGSNVMEQVLCEPVELTEFELDAVAGGNPFSGFTISLSPIGVLTQAFSIVSTPDTTVNTLVNNSITVS